MEWRKKVVQGMEERKIELGKKGRKEDFSTVVGWGEEISTMKWVKLEAIT